MRATSIFRGLPGWLRPMDGFGLLNVALFLLLAATTYWQRFREFRPQGNFAEFLVYGAVILVVIGAVWWRLRRVPFNLYALLALQSGILLHFAGGLLHPGGARLYDLSLGIRLYDYPLRFDKIVHLFNGLVGCIAAIEVVHFAKIRFSYGLTLLVCLSVLGIGAIVEVVEYFVVKTIPHNGVGDYDNNMTDLVANLLGCLVFACVRTGLKRAGVRGEFLRLSNDAIAP